MTYLSAASSAEQARNNANSAAGYAGNDTSQRLLAQAVAQLADAVAELARSHHRAQ